MRRLLAALILCAFTAAPLRAESVPPPDPDRFAAEIAAFVQADSIAPPPPGAIVFYGSSSIRMWHERLAADFAPLPVVGRGFGGSTMSEAAHWVGQVVVPLSPRAVVLYEGDNDIEMGRSPADVLVAFDSLAARLHAAVPAARVYVLSIKPSGARFKKWPKMREANRRLEARCRRERARFEFVDVATPMFDPMGMPRRELYLDDRLHLSAKGYDLWAGIVRETLLRNERPAVVP
jgi:lysophospholipase L1-like esterase